MQRNACTYVGCWYPIAFTLFWQGLVTSYDSENCTFQMINALCSDGRETGNMLHAISRSLKRLTSKSDIHGVLACRMSVGLVACCKFWSSTEGGFLISGICPKNPIALSLFAQIQALFYGSSKRNLRGKCDPFSESDLKCFLSFFVLLKNSFEDS